MGENNSLWDLFQQKNLSRRSFLKTCVTITGVMGLSPLMLSEVVAAAEQKQHLDGLRCGHRGGQPGIKLPYPVQQNNYRRRVPGFTEKTPDKIR